MTNAVEQYGQLTRRGKLRRVGRLARAALAQYDLDVVDMRLYRFATNPLYRVQTAGGRRLVLRMATPGWRTFDNLRAEAAWLEALARDTDIGAPHIVRSVDATAVLSLQSPDLPHIWHATLMSWVDGRLLAHYLDTANLEKMGALFAALHRHGQSWQPPPDFPGARFEQFLSRGEPDVLFEGPALAAATAADRAAFLRMRARVEDAYAALDRSDLRVIHCDLWHENIKLDRGRLRPFDFEDTIWGFRLHDIAMGMLDLLEDVGHERYVDLLAAFRQGYERHLDWPEGDLKTLQVGRLLWKANYVARFVPDVLPNMVAAYGRCFRQLEQTGTLRLDA